MASKREEILAFSKLKKTFSQKYCTLELTMTQYSTGTKDTIKYHAYVEDRVLGDMFITPMDAVNNVINKAKRKLNND